MAEGTRDYYDVLGVARSAGADEIQKAFRRLARSHHPDVNHEPGAEERFKELNEAYDVLSDPATRSRYDRFGPGFRQVPDGVDPEAWARAQRARQPGQGQAGRTQAGRTQTGRTQTGDDGFDPGSDPGTGFDDLLGGFVGGRGGRRRRGRGQGPTRGPDQEAELVLPIEDAITGGRRRITLSAGGSSGEERSVEVNIPPGVVTGQRVRVPGRGGAGTGDAPAGDLYLVIRLAPHARYRVEGRDLHVPLDLAPWEAALGTTVAVTTPTGETRVKVAAGTSSGRRLRLRGQGLPNPRGEAGDLFAEVRVVVPTELSPRERELFEALARESSFEPRPG